ncbi:MAG: M81 family metallopeptidase, partial [Thermomicrobiales bacterium]
MRALRVAAAQISHETNVFSSVRTDLAAFARSGQLLDAEIVMKERGTNSAFGGFTIGAANLGFELLPMVSVWATPSGIVTAEAFEALSHMLLDRLRHLLAHRGIDGVALALHGAMVSENDMDGDALLLERVRETVGGDIPIVGTLDLHANISERMLNAADVLVGYDTYPHVDMAERA